MYGQELASAAPSLKSKFDGGAEAADRSVLEMRQARLSEANAALWETVLRLEKILEPFMRPGTDKIPVAPTEAGASLMEQVLINTAADIDTTRWRVSEIIERVVR